MSLIARGGSAERFARSFSSRRGFKFEAGGLFGKHTGARVPTVTEKDVFRALDIPWLRTSWRSSSLLSARSSLPSAAPHLRNADP